MVRLIGLLLLFVSCTRAAHAQQEPLFDLLTTADGLPDPMVNALFEDREGFIWVGTGAGLARLEGTRIRVFHHDRKDPRSLAHDQVTDITASPSGVLYVATSGGLSRSDRSTGRFDSWRIPGLGVEATLANRLTDVLCANDTVVWLLTENGAYRFDVRTETFFRLAAGPVGKGPPGERIAPHGMCWDERGQGLWLATDKGLAFWNVRSWLWMDHRNAPPGYTMFQQQHTTVPVLDPAGGLWYFDYGNLDLIHSPSKKSVGSVIDRIGRDTIDFAPQDMLFGRHGDLWLSTWTYRLLHRDVQGHWTEVQASAKEPGRLARTNIKSILETASGEWWFGTSEGIGILRPSRQRMQLLRVGQKKLTVTAILPWSNDTTLVGTSNSGVQLIDHRTGEQRAYLPGSGADGRDTSAWHRNITDLERRDAQRAWVGSMSSPQVLELGSGHLRPATELRTPQLFRPLLNVSFLRPEGDSLLWVGTWKDGLYLIAPGHGTVQHFGIAGPLALPDKGVLCWLRTRDGARWVGMNDGGGSARVFRDRVEPFRTTRNDRTGGVVRCLAEAPDGQLWMGTHEEGIEVVDLASGRITYLTRQDGLPSDRVLGIAFDLQGGAWAATDQGVAFMPPGSSGFHTISLPSGLDPLGTSGALVRMPDGRMAFGVGAHLVLWRTDLAAGSEQRPRAVFTTLITNDSILFSPTQDQTLTLKHDAKALTLEVGAIGLAPSERPYFRYRVGDLDTSWSLAGQTERINLYDLPTGEHRIDLQASANGVDWSERSTTLQVKVLSAFWATWWFRSLVLTVLLSGIYFGFRGYVRGRLRQERERHAREQAVLTERMRIAGDMHDDLGAGLSALKLRSEMALRVEKDPVKREQLSGLASTAGELIGSMRQIIWTMNADQTSLEDLVVYTTSYARTYAGQQELGITVRAEGPWPPISLTTVQRRNVFLVVKEALHNIVKHAHARQVVLELVWAGELVVDLHDDGIGLPQGADLAAGNGLRNMRRRILDLGGSLSLSGSPAGTGTRITFSVPLPHTPNERSIATDQVH